MAGIAFDPFQALQVSRDASGSTIKAQFHHLARRYHPNRHAGSESTKQTLSDHFHHIHEAWRLLEKEENRRRRAELLALLELQEEMHAHFMDLVHEAADQDESLPDPGRNEGHMGADNDGNISSDADEDLPSMGLARRQTFLARNNRGAQHLGDDPDPSSPSSVTSPTRKQKRFHWPKPITSSKPITAQSQKDSDYFAERRKKLHKLRKKELEAFIDYRDAKVAVFDAEEEAERLHEVYEEAKWKREYLERAPRGMSERMRSFAAAMGAVTAFHGHTPRQRNRSSLSHSNATPVSGPGEGPQFLRPEHAITRQKTMHKRGWSNDISGDQTDSEDDSGDAYSYGSKSFVASAAYWRHDSRRSRHTSRDTYRKPTIDGPLEQIDQLTGLPTAVKILIRQPTDLTAIREERSSSGDTPSVSSREPSPNYQSTGMEMSRFTMLPSPGTAADIFGVPPERRSRSPSPLGHRRSLSSLSTKSNGHELHADGCQFETKSIGIPHHHNIPREHVHKLNGAEKSRLLGVEASTELDPNMLLARLASMDPKVAEKFEVKQDIKESFNFRLIYSNQAPVRTLHQSYIALSYRRKLQVEKNGSHFTLPLEPEIFQAVWEERQSEAEGLWIDQICIKQESDFERTVSMSAMDMVYRSARRVIVALDDIELDSFEGEILQKHMDEYNAMNHVAPRQRFRRKQPPYLESHETMFKIVRKILRSSWFKRAWCRHEMRLGKHHIFLIPCKRPGTWSGRDVLRFNGKTIAHLLDLSTEVPFESDVEAVKPALHAFFRDRSKMAPDETKMTLHHGNFSTVVAEVFDMEAGGDPRIPAEQRLADARKDKIAIILNTMECGLALHKDFRDPKKNLSPNECYHDLLLLGLAAQDPGALCSVGAPLPITSHRTSWLCVPTVADSGLNNSKTLPRLPENASFIINTTGPEHHLDLDLKFLSPMKPLTDVRAIPEIGSPGLAHHFVGASLDELRPIEDAETMKLARDFIQVCNERHWGRNRKRYLTKDRKANLLFGPMTEVYVETLACVFQCGPDWMSDVAQRYSMGRWKVDLKGAWELLIALQNTRGRWPAEAWSERAAGFVMDFVNFLVIRGLPQRQVSKPEKWRPLWVPTEGDGKVLTFVPIGNENIRAAIPTVLVNPEYVHLARLWILEPRPVPRTNGASDVVSQNEHWTLLGKSVVFSDEISIGLMSEYHGDTKRQQRIYGRSRPHANGDI
ncbi:unnamed protein product [Zymoseptoria tritici ST99CH_1A5]|uniref:J domain-containing protein n=1 Tax=Zymoseptoria tritici ST99CH_1A5 TaxID=1276529 RepID=A0A1Y6L9R4_ZYMTR|nr:unnamed protein product [Zymoseptoria tritici ST99CH_1A5]